MPQENDTKWQLAAGPPERKNIRDRVDELQEKTDDPF